MLPQLFPPFYGSSEFKGQQQQEPSIFRLLCFLSSQLSVSSNDFFPSFLFPCPFPFTFPIFLLVVFSRSHATTQPGGAVVAIAILTPSIFQETLELPKLDSLRMQPDTECLWYSPRLGLTDCRSQFGNSLHSLFHSC